MRVLLIYENIPEATTFYGLTDPTEEQLEVLELAHGHVINYDMPDKNQVACEKLNQALSKPEHIPDDDGDLNIRYEGWSSIWLDKQIDLAALPALEHGPWDRVYWSGFAL